MASGAEALYTPNVIHGISQLRPGLIVLQPVRDPRGQVLLPVGATISESIIALLEQRGIQAVDVEATETPEARDERIARESARIDGILPANSGSDELEQLRRILLEVLHA